MCDEFTKDTILGGSVIIKQPRYGYRISSDSIFLAASVPLGAGDQILDLGAGTGAISLALAKRCSKVFITAIENHTKHLKCLYENIELNNLLGRIDVMGLDISELPDSLIKRKFDHVVCNPPFYNKSSNQLPGETSKRVSSHEGSVTLEKWIKLASKFLKKGGSFSLIMPSNRYDESIEILSKYFLTIRILELIPRKGKKSKRILLQGWTKGIKQIQRLDSIELHTEKNNNFTNKAEKILREGNTLMLAEPFLDQ